MFYHIDWDWDLTIQHVVAIMIASIGAFAAYKGAVKGARAEIAHQKEMIEKSKNEHKQFTEHAIERLVEREITKNLMSIHNKIFYDNLRNNPDKPFYYNFEATLYFDEFNVFKKDIIRYKSDKTEEVLEIYDMFKQLEAVRILTYMKESDYKKLRLTYLKALKTYTVF